MSFRHLIMLRQLENTPKKEMATVLGVSQSFYSHLEKGIKDLTSQHKDKICQHFDMPLSFFEANVRIPYIISLHEN